MAGGAAGAQDADAIDVGVLLIDAEQRVLWRDRSPLWACEDAGVDLVGRRVDELWGAEGPRLRAGQAWAGRVTIGPPGRRVVATARIEPIEHAGAARHLAVVRSTLRPVAETVAADLPEAIAAGDIIPAFQPVYRLADGSLQGFEALARWRHPRLGDVPPTVFIALAERSGLIHTVGDRMLQAIVPFLRGLPDPTLSVRVNVSVEQLARSGFADRFAAGVGGDRGLLGRMIVEITESAFADGRLAVAQETAALRALGVGIAVDDFGSGYSSLSQLHDLPATEVKLDRAFVQRTSESGMRVLELIVRLAAVLGLGVVAEGVETVEQLAAVRAAGCESAQGFLLGGVLPPDDALRVALG